MRMEWRRRLSGVAALIGVLAVLLAAAAPAAAQVPSDRNLARVAQQYAGQLPQAGPGDRAIDRPGLAGQGLASGAIAPGPDVPMPDCPDGDGKACCPMSACPVFTMASPAGTASAAAWAGMAVAFFDPGAAGHIGLDALPLTPPPRGRA